MNIGSLFSRHAKYRPNHLAVVFEDQRLTWLEFNQQINRLANAFIDLGIQKGDKVATILPNCLELLEVYWAVAKMGAVVVQPTFGVAAPRLVPVSWRWMSPMSACCCSRSVWSPTPSLDLAPLPRHLGNPLQSRSDRPRLG